MSRKIRHAASSGNVFKDLGVSSPEETYAKAELTATIADIIRAAGLTQAAAARIPGIDQPKVSALLRGRLSGFSTPFGILDGFRDSRRTAFSSS